MNVTRFQSLRTAAFLAAIGLTMSRAAASAPAISPQELYWETEVGQRTYMSYVQRGEVVPRESYLYAILDPIAKAIAAVADRRYYAPFRFVLLNEAEPNAFSMPGGNVYVTTALLSYLRNRDELAGVLCHEVNHDIHHDMYNIYQAQQRGAQTIVYEREAEANADRAGAYTCAKAGFNAWGMVWNMRLHSGMGPSQMASASDHPSDAQRIRDLSALLRNDTATFGRFRDDITASVPLRNASAFAQSGYGVSPYPPQYQPQYPPAAPQIEPYPPPPPPSCYPGC